jgi:hypothetical protein
MSGQGNSRERVGEPYRVGPLGFKPDLTVGYTGLAYRMAGAATRGTHISSRLHPYGEAERGGWRLSGRERESNPQGRIGASTRGPARECER